MRCSKCGTDNPSANNFCAKCGNALAKPCAKCKAENPPTSDFCGKCGTRLNNGADAAAVNSSQPGSASGVHVAPEQTSADAAALDGKRKTVTALFADIKGSTELMEELDPEEARAVIDPALKLMIDAVQRYEGYIVQSTGDGGAQANVGGRRKAIGFTASCCSRRRLPILRKPEAVSSSRFGSHANRLRNRWSCARR